jgi:hypothetical protein
VTWVDHPKNPAGLAAEPDVVVFSFIGNSVTPCTEQAVGPLPLDTSGEAGVGGFDLRRRHPDGVHYNCSGRIAPPRKSRSTSSLRSRDADRLWSQSPDR